MTCSVHDCAQVFYTMLVNLGTKLPKNSNGNLICKLDHQGDAGKNPAQDVYCIHSRLYEPTATLIGGKMMPDGLKKSTARSKPKGIEGHSPFAQSGGDGTESWAGLPILPFEPTTPVEARMVCDRLNLIWISELYRGAIDWNKLEAVSAEISRLERALLSFVTEPY